MIASADFVGSRKDFVHRRTGLGEIYIMVLSIGNRDYQMHWKILLVTG